MSNVYMTADEFKKTLESLNAEYNQVCVCGRTYGSLYHEAGIYFNHAFVKA